jgi:hypothetical protein
VSKIKEYDLDIKPTESIKGQGLAKMLTESNEEANKMGKNDQVNVVMSELEHNECYFDIIYYLKNLSCLDHLVDHEIRALRLKAMKYCLTQDDLGWKNLDGVILRCVNKDESGMMIKELHFGHCGYHFSAHEILRDGYYWPTFFTDTYRYSRS